MAAVPYIQTDNRSFSASAGHEGKSNDETNAFPCMMDAIRRAFCFVIRISVIRHSFEASNFVIRHFK
jgi:hypothetical protein